jgi:hypothetical protein
MIIHNHVCNYCGDQMELPFECEEDSFFKSNPPKESKMYGIALDVVVSPIKSFDGYSKRPAKKVSLTFCGKECLVEYVRKSVSEEGKLEKLK